MAKIKTTETKLDTTFVKPVYGIAPHGFGRWVVQRTIVSAKYCELQRVTVVGTIADVRKALRTIEAPEGFLANGTGWTLTI